MSNNKQSKYLGIKVISIMNGVAAMLHLLFWILAIIKLPALSRAVNIEQKINLATVYGFGIADLIFSVPFLLAGAFLLWKIKIQGWLAAQIANVLYWYSFTVILSRDISSGALAPGTIIFLPFALFSIWAAYHLWQVRGAYLKF
jgi:hypothetical protein